MGCNKAVFSELERVGKNNSAISCSIAMPKRCMFTVYTERRECQGGARNEAEWSDLWASEGLLHNNSMISCHNSMLLQC
jgi:hypothetical protein